MLIGLCSPQLVHAQARAQLEAEAEDIVVTGERQQAPVTAIGSRLGLTARETPATVEVLDSETIRRQGYNTIVETVRSAAGVTSADTAAHTPYTMRGFQMAQVSVTHNGINLGSTDISGMNLNTFNLDRVEFLKGPSSIVSGQGSVGGVINFVTKAPHTGPIRSEILFGLDHRGSLRTGFGAGGSTGVEGLDFRIDISGSDEQSFIRDSQVRYAHFSGGLDFRVSPALKLFIAAEYRELSGETYWGTPLAPRAFSGRNATNDIVRGSLVSTFNGTDLGEVTIDRRTYRTNYNVLDANKSFDETWFRGGLEWAPSDAVSVRSHFFFYDARRRWLNNEVTAFNSDTNLVDRERFFVRHDQRQWGNNTDLTWNARAFGLENRMVVAFEHYDLDFARPGAANFPTDSVPLVDPQRGFYGPLTTARQTADLGSTAINLEDRLEITPTFALVGGLRYNRFDVDRNSTNAAGAVNAGFPLSMDWDPVTGRIGFTWDVVPNVTVYGQYATASDVALGSYLFLSPTQRMSLSEGRSVEGGVKASFLNGRGQATLAIYDIKRDGVYGGAENRRLTASGTLESRGVEVTADVSPVTGLNLWGNAAYTHARYRNYEAPGVSFSGNTPPNIPTWNVNAGGSYRFADLPLPIEMGGTVMHVGDRYTTDGNTVSMLGYTTGDVYAFIDLPEGLLVPSDRVRLALRVRNVTDERYAQFSDPFYPDQIFLGQPRTYEASLSLRF